MDNYSVFDIANWFLSKESMDHKKLQKLCYYAQAWSYVFNDKALFDGEFEAWVHGPVNRQLWCELKAYGYRDIPKNKLNTMSKSVCEKTSEFLERIWVTYGEFEGYQLEQLTHQEEPWIKARDGISENQICTTDLDADVIKKYYSNLISGEGNGE